MEFHPNIQRLNGAAGDHLTPVFVIIDISKFVMPILIESFGVAAVGLADPEVCHIKNVQTLHKCYYINVSVIILL